MGKFDGVLIASDYDNTLAFTEDALVLGQSMPAISEENRRAIEYFMAQGGVFSVATGRAKPAFDPVQPRIPMNGPAILFNGAALYDYGAQRYLRTAFLPDSVRPHIRQVLDHWPQAAVELYHDDNSIHALQSNAYTEAHCHITHAPTIHAASMEEVPSPIAKALFELDSRDMDAFCHYIHQQDWACLYEEVLPSNDFLAELTARGANKGAMVSYLAQLLHIAPQNIYCVGDHANDISMLQLSAIPFAPENAIPAVLAVDGLHRLPHARENAIAEMIALLDRRY